MGGDTATLSSNPPKDSSVWAYDYNTNTWEQKISGDGPAARPYPGIAYGSLADRIVMYGGFSAGWDETWVYNYNTNIWINMMPEVNPGQLSRFAFEYVPDIDGYVLFGGQIGSHEFEYLQSTWIYDLTNNTWTDVTRSP